MTMEGSSSSKRQASTERQARAERQASAGDNNANKRRKISEKEFPSKEELLSGIKNPSLEVILSRELTKVENNLKQRPALDDSVRTLEDSKKVLNKALLIIARVTSEKKETQEQGTQDLQDCLSKKDDFHQKVLTKITQTLDEILLEEVAPHPSDADRLGADPPTRASQSPDVVQRAQASDEGREKPSLQRKLADLKKGHEAKKLDPEIRSEQRWDLLASHLRSHFGPSLQIRLAYQKKFHEAEKLDPEIRSEQRWDLLASHLGPSLQRKLADQKKVHEKAKLDPEIRSEQRWDLLASHLEAVGGGEKDDRFDSQIDDIDPDLLNHLSHDNLTNTKLPLSEEIRKNAKIVGDYQARKKEEAEQVYSYEQASQALRNLKSATELLYDYSQAGDNSTLKKAVDAFKSLDDRYDTVPQADLDENPRMRINHAILRGLDLSTIPRMDEQAVLSKLNIDKPATESLQEFAKKFATSLNVLKDYVEHKNGVTKLNALIASGDLSDSTRALHTSCTDDAIRNINGLLHGIERDYYARNAVPQADLDENPRMRINHAILRSFDLSTFPRMGDQAVLARLNMDQPTKDQFLNFVRSVNTLKDYAERKNGFTEKDAIKAIDDYVGSLRALRTLSPIERIMDINAYLDRFERDYYDRHAVPQADLDENPRMRINHAILHSLDLSTTLRMDEQATLSTPDIDQPTRELLLTFARGNNTLKDYTERQNGVTEKDAIKAIGDYFGSSRSLRTLYPVNSITEINAFLDRFERDYYASHAVPQTDLDENPRMRINHAILHSLDLSTTPRMDEQATLSMPDIDQPTRELLLTFTRGNNIVKDYIEHKNGVTEGDATKAIGEFVDSARILRTLSPIPQVMEINAFLDRFEKYYYNGEQ